MSMDSWSGRVSEVLWGRASSSSFKKMSRVPWGGSVCSGGVSGKPSCVPCRWEGSQVIHHSRAHLSMGLSSTRNSAASSDQHLNPTFPKWCSSSVPVLCIFGRTFKTKQKFPESCCACWTWQKMFSWDCDLSEQRHCFYFFFIVLLALVRWKTWKTSNMKAVQQGWALQRFLCVFLVIFQWMHSFSLCSATTVPISSKSQKFSHFYE